MTMKSNKYEILVVGDLMVDEYLWGDVDRISPEAPVQVVSVKNENYTLGGSPISAINKSTLMPLIEKMENAIQHL